MLGSEPGIGWHWAVELAKRHDVVVVTRADFRPHIDAALASSPVPGLSFHYFDPDWGVGIARERQMFSRRYYLWWQWRVRRAVQPLFKVGTFDLVHHLTWGTFRFPSFLSDLGPPMVMGPAGGGEMGNLALLKGLPWRERLFDWVRATTLRISSSEVLAPAALKRSAVVLCKTTETLRALPPSVQQRAVVAREIAAPAASSQARVNRDLTGRPLSLLFAGRLMGWKGVALALGAVEALVKRGHDVTLDIAGEGPLEGYLRDQVARLGLAGRVRLLGMIPMKDLLERYGQADLFVFPSLHDSSGNVVLESLSRGLPVICLDLGGPPHYVNQDCARVVPAAGRSRSEVELALADAIEALIRDPAQLRRMSEAALDSVAGQTWAVRVDEAYRQIEARLGWRD